MMLSSLDRTRRVGITAFVAFIFLFSLLYTSFRFRLFRPSRRPIPTSSSPAVYDWDIIQILGWSPKSLNTTVVAHVPGFTVLQDAYLRDGTLIVVHPDSRSSGVPEGYPLAKDMISKAAATGPDVDAGPGDKELTFVNASDYGRALGPFIQRISGISVMIYDTTRPMNDYYHWWGEIILGVWRVHASMHGSLPLNWIARSPMRFVLPFSVNGTWRDDAGINAPLMRAAFFYSTIDESDWWSDLQKLKTTVSFDTLVLVNQNAAYRHSNSGKWHKMIGGTMDMEVPKGFWEPLRASVIRSFLGYIPNVNKRGAVVGSETQDPDTLVPLVTYISRQGSERRLTHKDHECLVAELEGLKRQGVIRFLEARMEDLSVPEQIELAARTTVMVGVHGDGLTHQLWMPSSPWSTVMEIFRPKAYVFDYEILSRNVGHRHYAVWNDTFVTYPEGRYHRDYSVPEDFRGNDIPVFGPAVAAKIKKRLAERH